MSAPVIALKGVCKAFLTDDIETRALDGVHLQVQRGEFIAIAGPSGCGKSTLLGILGWLDNASSGEYTLAGTLPGKAGAPAGAGQDARMHHGLRLPCPMRLA